MSSVTQTAQPVSPYRSATTAVSRPADPTVAEFLAANGHSEWGFFSPQTQEVALHTPGKALAFTAQFPHLKDEGWEITAMWPVRRITMMVTWDKDERATAQVLFQKDNRHREFKQVGHATVERLRKFWQATPQFRRTVTYVSGRTQTYTFEW